MFRIFLLGLIATAFFITCSNDQGEIKHMKQTIKGPVFYDKNYTGDWKNEAKNHVPQYHVKITDKEKIITVMAPFKGSLSPLHYIEAILLLDHNHKEIAKKTFQRGTPQASAIFKLKKDYKSFVYVVLKCNLHDMWEAKITW